MAQKKSETRIKRYRHLSMAAGRRLDLLRESMPGALRFAEGRGKKRTKRARLDDGQDAESNGTSSQQIAIIRKTRCRPSISRAPFLNAITPPTKAPASLRLSSMSPFFVIVVLRLTQMPWKLVSTSGANAEVGGFGGEVGAPPEAPWKLVMSEESDADATSTPGGGRTASIDAATTLCDDASAPAADSDAPVASADTTTAALCFKRNSCRS
jgi:hypothetical protein